MSVSSSVRWYHIGNTVSCHTLTFISFIQIYVVRETSNVTLMLTQWMGLSYRLHGGDRESRPLSEVAAMIEPVSVNTRGHIHMSIVRTRSRSSVRPSTCHLAEEPYTFRKRPALFSSLCPSSWYVEVIAASCPVSTVVGRKKWYAPMLFLCLHVLYLGFSRPSSGIAWSLPPLLDHCISRPCRLLQVRWVAMCFAGIVVSLVCCVAPLGRGYHMHSLVLPYNSGITRLIATNSSMCQFALERNVWTIFFFSFSFYSLL